MQIFGRYLGADQGDVRIELLRLFGSDRLLLERKEFNVVAGRLLGGVRSRDELFDKELHQSHRAMVLSVREMWVVLGSVVSVSYEYSHQ